jgi:Do/DeqQ family serine protease
MAGLCAPELDEDLENKDLGLVSVGDCPTIVTLYFIHGNLKVANMKKIWVNGLALGLLAMPMATSHLEAREKTPVQHLQSISAAFSNVAEMVTPSVLTIETVYEAQGRQMVNPFFRQMPRRQEARGSGSGVAYDTEGHIITNAHVIEDAKEIEVVLKDGQRLKAELVGTDPKTDLAVIKVNKGEIPEAKYGDSDEMNVGDWVIAIGNPLGFSHTVTHGIVSAKGRSGLRNDMEGAYENFIQTDASINQGNSGGPLCNIMGEVIGINSMIASQSGGSQGLGFAIPINMAKSIVDQLIASGEVRRGFLGVHIRDLDQEMAKQFGYEGHEGAIIDQVGPDTPASRAGLKSGDIVIALNGKKIKNSAMLRNNVSQNVPGSNVTIKVVRDGREKNIDVRLGSLEQATGARDMLGMEVRALSADELERYRVENGVMIENVEQGSAAAKAGLRPKMIISSVDRNPTHHPDDFHRAVGESLKGDDDAVLLYVRTNTHGFYIVVKVDK